MNEKQLQLMKDSTLEEIKDAIDWADEVLEMMESLQDLFSEPIISEIISDIPNFNNSFKFMNEFRKARNEVVEAYIKKKELIPHDRNAS